jgi:hypothetical protein
MLSENRDMQAAKHFFTKALSSPYIQDSHQTNLHVKGIGYERFTGSLEDILLWSYHSSLV